MSLFTQVDQEQPSDSILGLIVFAWEMFAPSQGCIIQIVPLCFPKVTVPWGGAVAAPKTPVLCYKTSESGILLSS